MTGETAALATGARRLLPHNLEAEMSVVGGILLHPKALYQVADLVEPRDFYHPSIAAIYEAMLDLDRSSVPIDQVTVGERMRAADTFHKLRAVNGEAYFGELMNSTISVENIRHHAQLIRTLATVRQLAETAQEIAAKAYGGYGDTEEFIAEAQKQVLSITDRDQKGGPVAIKPILQEALEKLEELQKRGTLVTGVPTGFTKFDRLTGGLQPGDLIIVAARPSMGKTSLVMNAAVNAAIGYGLPVLVFSLEMSSFSLACRILASEGRVNAALIRSGQLTAQDWGRLTLPVTRLRQAPLEIDDSSSLRMIDIAARARRWRANEAYFNADNQLGLIVVDYLQLIHPGPDAKKNSNREREVAEISRGLKGLAKDLRVPVVALSQLNRSLESRADKRPMLSDLRESGAIEQDADLVAFLYRDEVYDKDSVDQNVAEVILGKQRNGELGTVRLAFLKQYTRFENLREEGEE
jgi:replicative DNA helicase